jgi:hypothetical protein
MWTFAMLLALLCVSCTTRKSMEQTAVEQAYSVVAEHVFPGAPTPMLV